MPFTNDLIEQARAAFGCDPVDPIVFQTILKVALQQDDTALTADLPVPQRIFEKWANGDSVPSEETRRCVLKQIIASIPPQPGG